MNPMNRISNCISILSLLSLLVFTNCAEVQKKEIENKSSDWQFRQRAFPHGKIDKQAYLQAIQNFKHQKRSAESSWTFEGPINIGGRITDIETTEDKVYFAAASGGLFVSEDDVNWTPIFDDNSTLSIGDFDIADTDESIIYVGTGEANAGGGSLAYDGTGIYKTTNGGLSWENTGLQNGGSIGKVIVHPDNEDICYVAAMGQLFNNNNERGVYKTLDGGNNWYQMLYLNDSTGAIDLAMDPTKPDTLYAAMWERVRKVNRRNYGGPSSGIHRSFDGGITWTELTNGLPTTAGRIGISLAPSSPNILYAVYTDPETDYLSAIYKTEDYGESWVEKSIDNISQAPFNWWFGKIYVHPTNSEIVYVTSLDMHKSTDGSNSWSYVFDGAHVDHHAIAFDPTNPEKVYNGNDGGLYISSDGGSNYSKVQNLPITQFYTCEVDYSVPERLYGGTQDNSAMRTMTGETDDWEIIFYGDGFYTLIDPNDNNYIYTEYQYGGLGRSTDGGNSFSFATSGISSGDRINWSAPLAFNPHNTAELYFGSQRVYKTTDRAVSWSPISGDLTDGSTDGNLVYNTITSISVSELNPQIILVGTDDGNVSITTDGGTNWSNISSALPERWVTRVLTDKYDEQKIYVAISGYRFGEIEGHIYQSADLGSTWENISGDMPDIPVNSILQIKENQLAAATDVGVYITKNSGENWEIAGNNLPAIIITDLDYHEPTNTLIAATFGRGLYSYEPDTTSTNSIISQAIHNQKLKIYPNPAKDYITLKTNYNITQIEIIDNSGKTVLKSRNIELNKVDIQHLNPGIYIVRAFYQDNLRQGQFIKN
jgi:photosystem II stability/assembly factor-like uncharacterized protein